MGLVWVFSKKKNTTRESSFSNCQHYRCYLKFLYKIA